MSKAICVQCGAPAGLYIAGQPVCNRCDDQRSEKRPTSQASPAAKSPLEPAKTAAAARVAHLGTH